VAAAGRAVRDRAHCGHRELDQGVVMNVTQGDTNALQIRKAASVYVCETSKDRKEVGIEVRVTSTREADTIEEAIVRRGV
jgi:hypothetical protein